MEASPIKKIGEECAPHFTSATEITGDSAVSYRSTVTFAPIASAIRGVSSEVVLNEEGGMKAPCAVNLHNAVTVPQHRLGMRVAAGISGG